MPDTNPYLTVNSPSYAAPMLDWQKMAGGISGGLTGQGQQPQGAQPGQQPGQAPQPGQPPQQPGTQAQQQMQGLGARLRAMFGGQQPGGAQPGMGSPQMGPQPGMMPQPQGGGTGWSGGWNVNG